MPPLPERAMSVSVVRIDHVDAPLLERRPELRRELKRNVFLVQVAETHRSTWIPTAMTRIDDHTVLVFRDARDRPGHRPGPGRRLCGGSRATLVAHDGLPWQHRGLEGQSDH